MQVAYYPGLSGLSSGACFRSSFVLVAPVSTLFRPSGIKPEDTDIATIGILGEGPGIRIWQPIRATGARTQACQTASRLNGQ
jgi:hypothetical protein